MSASESGHWYGRDGTPTYTVNGRGTTLRDARRLSLVPSVTTVLNVVAKPALNDWLIKEGARYALNEPRIDSEELEPYLSRIVAGSRLRGQAAAEEGTRIHDACECLVKYGNCPEAYEKHATAAVAELRRLFPDVNDWVAEQSFAHPLGYGGKCDLHSPSTGIIVDYKTKDGDFTDGKKLAWDQHWQLAAYQVGLGLTDWRLYPYLGELFREGDRLFHPGAAIFVSRTHPGCVSSHVWSAEEMAQGWQVFERALDLWRVLKGYDPRF